MKPGYKLTDVGAIPQEWDARAIGYDIDLLTGFPFPSSGYSDSGVRLLRGSNVKRGNTDWSQHITQYWPSITHDFARYELRDGDLVIAMDGSLVGRSAAQLQPDDLPALLLQRVARIRSTKRLDVGYLSAFVKSDWFIQYSDSVKTVTAIPHISPSDIRNFRIPIPPSVDEQRAIASVLFDVDSLLAQLVQLITKKRDLKQAAMQQLLTGKTRLSGFSGEWDVVEFGDIVAIRNVKVISSSAPLGTRCVELESIGQANGSLLGWVEAKGSSSKYCFKKGDVLFGRLRAYLRKYWYAQFDGLCSTEIWPLIPCDERLSAGFLHLLVQTSGFVDAAAISYGTHMPRSDWSVLGKHKVQLPLILEQIAISTFISDMDAEIAALETRREKTNSIKQGMMQELLTGKTRLV